MTAAIEVDVNELKARFDEEGFVILRRVLEPRAIADAGEDLKQLVEQQALQLLADGLIDDAMRHEPFETRLYKLYQKHMDKAPNSFRYELHLPGMFGLFFNPRVLDLAEAILGPEIRLYPNYTCRPKLPDHKATEVLWHQDAGYTASNWEGKDHAAAEKLSTADLRMVNVWSPLVPATVENGCMQFIPRTHKLGVVPHVDRPFYLEIVEEELKPRLKDVVDIEMNPGDVVLFSNLLFHRGQPNRTQAIRWSCDWRYQDATQPTLRKHHGHLARSRRHPEQVVRDAQHWASLSFQ